MRRLSCSFASVLFATALGACGSGDTGTVDANEVQACVSTGRGDTYVAGLEKQGAAGKLDFHLVSADPSPPGRFLNNWVVQVNAMENGAMGAAVADAAMTVTPFMPDHQHGAGAYKTKVAPVAGENGMYTLTDINTWMPGYWEVTIDATAGASRDTVVYKFCIPE